MGAAAILTTDDCRATYEDLRAKGVEFTEEPTERPYGIDCALRDPFGNPVPPRTAEHPRPSADEVSVDRFAGRDTVTAVISRIGEPIQADAELLAGLEDAQIVAGAEVELRVSAGGVRLVGSSGDPVVLADDVARHLFVRR